MLRQETQRNKRRTAHTDQYLEDTEDHQTDTSVLVYEGRISFSFRH
jgi:hypothetical protein